MVNKNKEKPREILIVVVVVGRRVARARALPVNAPIPPKSLEAGARNSPVVVHFTRNSGEDSTTPDKEDRSETSSPSGNVITTVRAPVARGSHI
jgi:hypothetical protein